MRISLFALALLLSGCSDSDQLALSDYEKYDVGVWLSPPKGDAVHLGVVRGASACGSVAWNYASAKQYPNDRWGYACCTHRKGSTCYEKIR